MRRKFLLTSLLLFCFFAAWIGASYANIWLSDKNESLITQKSHIAMTVSSKPKNTPEESSIFDGVVLSEKPLSFEEMLRTVDFNCLDSILNVENDSFREVAIKDYSFGQFAVNEYLARLPLEAFPDEVRMLIDQMNGYQSEHEWEKNKRRECLRQMASNWLKRDFEAAKAFILNDLSSYQAYKEDGQGFISLSPFDPKPRSEEGKGTNILESCLLTEWMKRNKAECMQFLEENSTSEKPWVKEFVDIFFEEYPSESFYFINTFREYWGSQTLKSGDFHALFRSWYEKEGNDAVQEAVLNVSSGAERRDMIETLSREIAETNPDEAIALIKKEYPSVDGINLYLLFEVGQNARKTDDSMLDMIRQGTFSDQERRALMRGYISRMDLTSLNALLEDSNYLFSEEERLVLMKERLCSRVVYEEEEKTIYTSMRLISDEETSLAVQWFKELSIEQQLEVYENRNDSYNRKLTFLLYEELPSEKQSKEIREELFEELIQANVPFAAEYFLHYHNSDNLFDKDTGINEEVFAKEQSKNEMLKKIVDRYLLKDSNAAKSWIASIQDEELRNTANFLLSATVWRENPEAFVSQLNSIRDETFVGTVVESIAEKTVSDVNTLLPLVNGLTNETLARKLIDGCVDQVITISSDAVLDFMDGLHVNSAVQEYAWERCYNKALGCDPKLALELALEMSPGEKTKTLIQNALSVFQGETPERAERWLRENNIKLSQ